MPFKNKQELKEYNRLYRKENRERLNSLKRAWRKKNLSRAKLWESQYAKTYRQNNPDKFRAWDRKEKKKQRDRFRTFLRGLREKMGGACSECGYKENINILHFHHLREKIKEVTRFHSITKAEQEAKKCILLCPNCHAIETLKSLHD